MAAATGYNGLYGQDAYATLSDRAGPVGMLRGLLRKRGLGIDKAILRALVLGAVGDTASLNYKRVLARNVDDSLGGARTVESVDIINRATTSGDQTVMTALVLPAATSVSARDLSGNGSQG
jgi:hypothetical protein